NSKGIKSLLKRLTWWNSVVGFVGVSGHLFSCSQHGVSSFHAGISSAAPLGSEDAMSCLFLRSVIINDFDDDHPCYFLPVEPAVRLYRQRIVVRLKNKPAGMDQIDGQLSVPVSRQFVAPSPRNLPQVVQGVRRLDFRQPLLENLRATVAELAPHFLAAIAE